MRHRYEKARDLLDRFMIQPGDCASEDVLYQLRSRATEMYGEEFADSLMYIFRHNIKMKAFTWEELEDQFEDYDI